MPKTTFENLSKDKKKKLTDAFLREFANHTFDNASLSSVVKSLGIAKGSVYQYFEDKEDLFNYMISVCTQTKSQYLVDIKREHFPDFWEYLRQIFIDGVAFDLENPLQSHFLFNLTNSINSPSIQHLYDTLLQQSISGFEHLVNKEIDLGLFKNDVPPKTMAFLLYKSAAAIQEQMQAFGEINPKESIKENKPVYLGKEAVLIQLVDDYIKLLKPAFNKE
jgi:AcrR family transcriptional regulator